MSGHHPAWALAFCAGAFCAGAEPGALRSKQHVDTSHATGKQQQARATRQWAPDRGGGSTHTCSGPPKLLWCEKKANQGGRRRCLNLWGRPVLF